MKSVVQFKELTSNEREKNLKSRATKAARDELKKEIAKILVAAEECGDFGKGKGEMNSWAVRATGMELRREVQGTYEYANVLRGIRSGELPDLTEEEFDKAPSFGLIKLSGFMGKKDAGLVSAALEIIRSKKDVTNRLRELTAKPKETESKDSTESKGSGKSGKGDSLNSDSPAETDAPQGQTFFVPEGTAILNEPGLVRAIVEEIAACDSQEKLEAYLELFRNFSAHVESRWEKLEAEASTPAKELAAA